MTPLDGAGVVSDVAGRVRPTVSPMANDKGSDHCQREDGNKNEDEVTAADSCVTIARQAATTTTVNIL